MGQIDFETHPAVWSGLRIAYSISFCGDRVVVWRAEKAEEALLVYDGAADLELEGWRRALRDMQAEQSAGQAVVSTALPSTLGFVVPLATPLASRSKALKVMPGLLDLELPFPVEDCRFALLDVHTTGAGGVQSLTAGARDRDISVQREEWGRLKVAPSMLDLEGLVLWDQWRREALENQGEAYQALIHFHPERTTLVLGSSKHIHAVRNLHQGAESSLERFKPALLRMLRGQEEVSLPQTVWVSGRVEGARVQELRDVLRNEGWPLLNVLPKGESLLERGTVVRALNPSNVSINLLQDEEQPDSLIQHRRRRTRHAGVLAGICGGLMICAGVALKQAGQHRLETIDQTLREEAMTLTGYAASSIPRNQEVLVVSRVLEEKGQLESPLLIALQPSLADNIVQITEFAEQRGIQLQRLHLSQRAMYVSGKGKSWSSAEALLEGLAVLGRDLGLRRVNPSDVSSTAFIINQRGAQ